MGRSRSRSGSLDSWGRRRQPRGRPNERGRDRSRERSRDRSRDCSRDRPRDRRGGRGQTRSRSRSFDRRRHRDSPSPPRRSRRSPSPPRSYRRSRSPIPKRNTAEESDAARDYRERILQGDGDSTTTDAVEATADADDGLTEEEKMMALMGFGGFNTTKGQQVDDNVAGPASGAVRKTSKREYRQFMNKRGGIPRGPPPPPSM